MSLLRDGPGLCPGRPSAVAGEPAVELGPGAQVLLDRTETLPDLGAEPDRTRVAQLVPAAGDVESALDAHVRRTVLPDRRIVRRSENAIPRVLRLPTVVRTGASTCLAPRSTREEDTIAVAYLVHRGC